MFAAFALLTLAGALAMFRQRNAVMAGLCLVVCFLGVAGLFLLLGNPVAAALQLIVYAGAILVLLLFVIMLLSDHAEEDREASGGRRRWGRILLGTGLVLGLSLGALKLVLASPLLAGLSARAAARPPLPPVSLQGLGTALFNGHLVAFEAAGLLLLAAMLAAVSLVKRAF